MHKHKMCDREPDFDMPAHVAVIRFGTHGHAIPVPSS